MMRLGGFSLRTECRDCGQPLPLVEPVQMKACGRCGCEQVLDPEIWATVLAGFDDRARALGEAADRHTEDVDGRPLRWEQVVSAPKCERCGASWPVESLPADLEHAVNCPGCGDPGLVRPAPDWLRAIVPTATTLYFPEPPLSRSAAAPTAPVLMSCPGCGAGLKITSDRPRILPCEYCHSDVFLPDEVWVRLHPVETARRFYVRFEGRTRAELRREAAERLAHDETEARARAGAAAYQAAQARIESDRAARHERVSAALARAWAATLVFATCMLILLGFALFAGPRGLGELLPLTIVLAVPTCVSLFVATHLAGKPMTETTGHAFEWILFVTWFWVPFVMFAPIFGQVIGLVRVVMLALGRVSGGTITSGGNRTHYDPVRFGMGEGRPAAVLFLVLTLVWPLVVLCLGALEDA